MDRHDSLSRLHIETTCAAWSTSHQGQGLTVSPPNYFIGIYYSEFVKYCCLMSRLSLTCSKAYIQSANKNEESNIIGTDG